MFAQMGRDDRRPPIAVGCDMSDDPHPQWIPCSGWLAQAARVVRMATDRTSYEYKQEANLSLG